METYEPGDKVKITEYYLDNYPVWGAFNKDTEATVLEVKAFKVISSELSKEDRALYVSRYGVQKEYICYQLLIDLRGKQYIVSQLGFAKV